MSARDEILQRVRAALRDEPEVPPSPQGRRGGEGPPLAELVERFCERVTDYGAAVARVAAGDVPAAIAAACERSGARRVVAAPGVRWRIPGPEVVADSPRLGPGELERFDGTVTGCALAIADTGTIVLDGGPASGRRAITLVPDHHICVVFAAQLVAGVPDAVASLAEAAAAGAPLTFVSGPSATSDIELSRVEGVHGPRRVDVVMVS